MVKLQIADLLVAILPRREQAPYAVVRRIGSVMLPMAKGRGSTISPAPNFRASTRPRAEPHLTMRQRRSIFDHEHPPTASYSSRPKDGPITCMFRPMHHWTYLINAQSIPAIRISVSTGVRTRVTRVATAERTIRPNANKT